MAEGFQQIQKVVDEEMDEGSDSEDGTESDEGTDSGAGNDQPPAAEVAAPEGR